MCLASGYVGIQIERRYKERTSFYEDFKSYLEFSENRISAFKSPVTEILKESKFDVVNDGIKELWNPDEDALQRCREFGSNLI